MNLRDKLKALESGKPAPSAPKPPPKAWHCWHTSATLPLSEFPDAFSVSRDTVMLMQGDEMPRPFDPRRILYLDTETTGLGGGAGTVAFEVGLGYLTDSGFVVHQYLMRDYPEERDLLENVMAVVNRFDVLCTFNGRTFDLPLLRTRLIMNRLSPAGLDKPHIDLLHIARRVWKLRLKRCNLSRLEECILGIPREHDLPGALVPERFFNYLKSGDFTLFDEVLEHNQQDIASLCTLLAHMVQYYERPEDVIHEEDVFSMGVALERMHHPEEARRCYRLASVGCMKVAGQMRLAGCLRRSGERQQACRVWEDMVRRREGGTAPMIELAKYYEHTARDIPAALDITQKALSLLAEPGLYEDDAGCAMKEDLLRRYDRLRRKIRKP
ncbi:MAG: hypothetical protein E7333_04470 [Clostridiales bacterium]|nr:hypothetical protein [Clostridiales bacterium]